jgi:hypothetical protein
MLEVGSEAPTDSMALSFLNWSDIDKSKIKVFIN